MNPDKYAQSAHLTRAFAVVRLLFGHTFRGLSTGEIAKAIRDKHGNVTPLIARLHKLGVVEEIKGSGRWRLGPAMVQGALAHAHDLNEAEAELSEIKQRYSRRPD